MIRHSRGSVYELRTLIEGARRFCYIQDDDAVEILRELVEISKMIDGFLKGLERKIVRESAAEYVVAGHATVDDGISFPDC
jgi:hypothetical protein